MRADRQHARRTETAVDDVERRELTDYDAAFGLLDSSLPDTGRVA